MKRALATSFQQDFLSYQKLRTATCCVIQSSYQDAPTCGDIVELLAKDKKTHLKTHTSLSYDIHPTSIADNSHLL